MLENSYDASCINFGILLSSRLPYSGDKILKERPLGINDTFEKICVNEANFIEFSSCDGLTPINILNICPHFLSDEVFVFVVYNALNLKNQHVRETNYINIIDYIPIILNNTTCNVPIDELMVDYYLNNYNELITNYCHHF